MTVNRRDQKRKNSDSEEHQIAINGGRDDGDKDDVDCSLTLGFSFFHYNSSTPLPTAEKTPPVGNCNSFYFKSNSPEQSSPPPPPPPPSFSLSSLPPPAASYSYFMKNNLSTLDPQQWNLEAASPLLYLLSSPAPAEYDYGWRWMSSKNIDLTTAVTPPSAPAASPSLPYFGASAALGPPQAQRPRRNPTQQPKNGKSEIIPPPFPWAREQRGTLHSLDYLLSRGIVEIEGETQCRRCEAKRVMKHKLEEKFWELAYFIANHKEEMRTRAPAKWMEPVYPECEACGQTNSMRPVVAEKKRKINWLFMLLGQSLVCCTIEQLKYFCKHSKNHRTGAKDRVLYLTYLAICKQLCQVNLFNPMIW